MSFSNSELYKFNVKRIQIDLTDEKTFQNALEISNVFTSLYIENASDNSCNLKIKFDSNDSVNDEIRLFRKDVMNFNHQVKKCFLSWDSQPSKNITLILMVNNFITPSIACTNFSG